MCIFWFYKREKYSQITECITLNWPLTNLREPTDDSSLGTALFFHSPAFLNASRNNDFLSLVQSGGGLNTCNILCCRI